MMIEATKLINLPVAAEDSLSKIGLIRQIVVSPENGQILGFLVMTGFFGSLKALSIIDIRFWDANGLVTKTVENLVAPDEIVRMKNVLDQDINLMNMPAQTESGKSLGQVENFLIDTETSCVVKYYLRDMLGKTRVMSADQVVSIDKKITFADDEGAITSGVAEAQTA